MVQAAREHLREQADTLRERLRDELIDSEALIEVPSAPAPVARCPAARCPRLPCLATAHRCSMTASRMPQVLRGAVQDSELETRQLEVQMTQLQLEVSSVGYITKYRHAAPTRKLREAVWLWAGRCWSDSTLRSVRALGGTRGRHALRRVIEALRDAKDRSLTSYAAVASMRRLRLGRVT